MLQATRQVHGRYLALVLENAAAHRCRTGAGSSRYRHQRTGTYRPQALRRRSPVAVIDGTPTASGGACLPAASSPLLVQRTWPQARLISAMKRRSILTRGGG